MTDLHQQTISGELQFLVFVIISVWVSLVIFAICMPYLEGREAEFKRAGDAAGWGTVLPVATWLTFVMWQPAGVFVGTLGVAILVGILREKPYVD